MIVDDDAHDWAMMHRFFSAYSREQQQLVTTAAPLVETAPAPTTPPPPRTDYRRVKLNPGDHCVWKDEGLGRYEAHYHTHTCTRCGKDAPCFYAPCGADEPHSRTCQECSQPLHARGTVALFGPVFMLPSTDAQQWRLYVVLGFELGHKTPQARAVYLPSCLSGKRISVPLEMAKLYPVGTVDARLRNYIDTYMPSR